MPPEPVYNHFYGYHGTAGMAAMGIDPVCITLPVMRSARACIALIMKWRISAGETIWFCGWMRYSPAINRLEISIGRGWLRRTKPAMTGAGVDR